MRPDPVASEDAQQHVRVGTVGDIGVNAIGPGDLGGPDFTRRATTARAMRGAAGQRFDTGIDFLHHWYQGCLRMEVRISRVEAVQVAQDDQHLSVYKVT